MCDINQALLTPFQLCFCRSPLHFILLQLITVQAVPQKNVISPKETMSTKFEWMNIMHKRSSYHFFLNKVFVTYTHSTSSLLVLSTQRPDKYKTRNKIDDTCCHGWQLTISLNSENRLGPTSKRGFRDFERDHQENKLLPGLASKQSNVSECSQNTM